MNLEDRFFESDVEFTDAGGGIVESEHPSLRNRFWELSSLVGLVAGAFLLLTGEVCATDFKVTPLESAALELEQRGDAARVNAQALDKVLAEGYALVARIQKGEPIGSASLRTEVARLIAVSDSSQTNDEHATSAAVAFITAVGG